VPNQTRSIRCIKRSERNGKLTVKTGDERKRYLCTIKIARPHRLRDICDHGNSEPNDTLNEVKCISESTT
jgi:hypothetical protein